MEDNKMHLYFQDAPFIISASKCTDIPAFYMEWFMKRLEVGHSLWVSPHTGIKSQISYENARFIVFWSKNPRPLLKYLDKIDAMGYNYYIHYTLNDYEKEDLEPKLPNLRERIDTFKMLVDRLGPKRVIWRFDPLILTNNITDDILIEKISNIGNILKGYTEKLVFSYADISTFQSVRQKLIERNVSYREWDIDSMTSFAKKLSLLNEHWNLALTTCGEKIDLSKYGVGLNKCIDDNLIIQLAYNDEKLMNFLGVKMCSTNDCTQDAVLLGNGNYAIKTKTCGAVKIGKRTYCGCIPSRDIGEFSTCPHSCIYCYANDNNKLVMEKYNSHLKFPWGGNISGGEE